MTARGLDGIRVVELGQMVAAPWTAKLLADLGADVIKVEPPQGDAARRRGPFAADRGRPDSQVVPDAGSELTGGLFAAINTNKRGIMVDLARPDGRATLQQLLADADLFIHDLAPGTAAAHGLTAEPLRAEHPSLVTMSITPFGQTGPYAAWRATELQVVHGGGWGWLTPGCVQDAELPPLKPHGHQAAFQSGFAAACASLAAVDRAQRTGRGEHIDFAQMSYVVGMLEAAFISWSYRGENPSRLGARILNPWGIFPTGDGHIFLVCVEADQWERLKDFMGRPEWADMDIFSTLEGRFENEDLLRMWLGEWIAAQPVTELFHRGQAERLAFAPVNTVAQMAADPHLAARDFLVTYEQPGLGDITVPGAPSRLTNSWWSIRRPAPSLGEHSGASFAATDTATASLPASSPASSATPSNRPLDGVTVADFTWVWAGPYCTLHLAHLGATVIKVESSARPDLGRRLPTQSGRHTPTLDTNGYFNQYGQGKQSITIDLGTAEGRALAKRLALACDLVVSNYATGVMDEWGLGYEALAAERPDVIVGVISGYGHHGPYQSYMGYGPTTGPLSGLASMTGYPGTDADELGVSLGDPAAGIATAYALVAALVARRRTGEGQFIDTSMWEATTACTVEGWMEWVMRGTQPDPMGNLDPLWSPHNLYRCAGNDDWVAVCCVDEAEWAALARITGIDPDDERFATAAGRKANEAELDKLIGAWTRERDQWDITELLQAAGVPAFPSLSSRSLEVNPHLAERGLIERLDHPVVGQMSHVGIPWLLTDGTNGVRSPAPTMGQHTHGALADVLGLNPAEIAALEAAGALR
ncbi:MAG: CoA transferase [Acidimicrobiales bacterium]|nr:CoA transferase [Acidimicrobiales bacterium]MXX41775.1 CoA transferase [Acidimicrobiales bacterium]MYB82125.1 CoA transferase [Acidimicrobiales bacterium]MYD33689.1 CoA transferase [Acidimicrobiales bacterium]MYI08875.1 CoA transferase [Acidimicrobiales bacterium]